MYHRQTSYWCLSRTHFLECPQTRGKLVIQLPQFCPREPLENYRNKAVSPFLILLFCRACTKQWTIRVLITDQTDHNHHQIYILWIRCSPVANTGAKMLLLNACHFLGFGFVQCSTPIQWWLQNSSSSLFNNTFFPQETHSWTLEVFILIPLSYFLIRFFIWSGFYCICQGQEIYTHSFPHQSWVNRLCEGPKKSLLTQWLAGSKATV